MSVVAYTGIQGRARDAQRKQDVKTIAQALEMYYLDNGKYPPGKCVASATACVINTGWSTTNDTNVSWANLENALVPKYISALPTDPNPTMGQNPQSSGVYGYGYFATEGGYCGVGTKTYILIYTLESGTQQNTLSGACNTPTLGPYPNVSNYRVVAGG